MRFLSHFGRYMIMLGALFARPESFRMYIRETFRQMINIGVGSLPIVAMISFFIGAVTALQTAFQLVGSFIPRDYVGYIVRDTMFLELAPTFSCLVLAGKVGSNVSSELGTMRITEQIDALEIMGVNTRNYLIGPKLIAAIITIPQLIIFSAALGVLGGYAAIMGTGAIEPQEYITGVQIYFNDFYIVIMEVKALVFAFLLTSISCYQGFYVKGGALDIGAASTRAVVFSSVMILVADYFLALLFT